MIPRSARIRLTRGMQTLPADLYHAGYKNQSSIDFSSIAIAAMKEKYAALTELDWRVMDVRKMEYESASFNIAIDKVSVTRPQPIPQREARRGLRVASTRREPLMLCSTALSGHPKIRSWRTQRPMLMR